MLYGWVILFLALSVADWAAVFFRKRRLRFFTKPAPMLVLILWFSLVGAWRGPLLLFGVAFVLSLLGDILLLFPPRFFIAGLTAFLLAHIFFIIGFNAQSVPIGALPMLLAAAVFALGVLDLRPVVRGIRTDPVNRKLALPVMFYGIIISLMAISALLNFFRPEWSLPETLLTVFGAALFFASDSILARVRFLYAGRIAATLVMVTYLLGQLLIALGVLLHYAG